MTTELDEGALGEAIAWAEERWGRRVDGWQKFGLLIAAARERDALRRDRERLVEALREELALSCSGAPARSWDGGCSLCGSQSCVRHHALLAELDTPREK